MNVNTSVVSPNYSSRGKRPIKMIVMHGTAGRFASDIPELTDDTRPLAKRKSIHYYIKRDGDVYQLVSDDYAAWHAGVSQWDGKDATWIMQSSIGIELENLNDGKQEYPNAQFNSAVELVRTLLLKYDIDYLVRHSDIAPTRKTDPRGFKWQEFLDIVQSGKAVESADAPKEAVETVIQPDDRPNNTTIIDDGTKQSKPPFNLKEAMIGFLNALREGFKKNRRLS